MTDLPHAKRPCNECPWRLDQPTGRFSAERFELLRETAGSPGMEAPLFAPMFACHKSTDGKDIVCAGWLSVVGGEHLGVRMAVAMGRLPFDAGAPGDDWPELYPTYEAMAAANGASV